MAFALNAELKISTASLTAVQDKLQKLENLKVNVTPVLSLADIKQQIKDFNASNALSIHLTPKLAITKKAINDQIKDQGDFDIRLNTIVNTKTIQKQLKDAGPFTVEVVPVMTSGGTRKAKSSGGSTSVAAPAGPSVNDVIFTGPSGNIPATKIKEIATQTRAAQKEVASLDSSFEQVARRKVFFQAPKISSSRTELKALNKEIEAIDASYRKLNSVVHGSSETFDEFGQRVGISVKRFIAFSAGTSVLVGSFAAIKNSIGAAIDYEKEISKIAQVSESSLSSISKLRKEILGFSAAIGVDSKELAVSAATLAQTGIGLSKVRESIQAIGLARLSPSFGSAKDTIEGLIAVQAQFGKESGPAIEILSKINAVSKAYAVESEDLVSAVQKSGGAFKTARGSFEQFIGTITAIRSTTRESADSIATGLRTIVARLQRPKTIDFLEDVLGIDLRESGDRLKTLPIFDAIEKIREGISKKGLTPGDTILSQVIEEIGGIRQSSRVIPLLFDQGKATQATNLALASSESLALDAAIAQETLSNRLQKTIENFKLFGDTVLQDKGFRFFADTALNLANAIAKIGSALTPVIPLLGALAITTGANILPKLLGGVQKVGVRQSGLVNPTQFLPKTFEARAGGGPIYFGGNKVHGHQTANFGGQDTVPALLKPGEVVLNEAQQRKISGVAGINRGEFFGALGVPGFAYGGIRGRKIGLAGGTFGTLGGPAVEKDIGNEKLPARGKRADVIKHAGDIAGQFGLGFDDLFSNARYYTDKEIENLKNKKGGTPAAGFNRKSKALFFTEQTNKKQIEEEVFHSIDLLLGGGEYASSQEGHPLNDIFKKHLPITQEKFKKKSKEELQYRLLPEEIVAAALKEDSSILPGLVAQFKADKKLKEDNSITLAARERAAVDRAKFGMADPEAFGPPKDLFEKYKAGKLQDNYIEVGTNSFSSKFGKNSETQDNLLRELPEFNGPDIFNHPLGLHGFRAKTDDAYGKLHEGPSFSGDVNSSLPYFGKEDRDFFKYELPIITNQSNFSLPDIKDNTNYTAPDFNPDEKIKKKIKRKQENILSSMADEFSPYNIADILGQRDSFLNDQAFREGARLGNDEYRNVQDSNDRITDFIVQNRKKSPLFPTIDKFLKRRAASKALNDARNTLERRQARAFKDIGTNLFSNSSGERKEGYRLSEVRKRFGFAGGGIATNDQQSDEVETLKKKIRKETIKGILLSQAPYKPNSDNSWYNLDYMGQSDRIKTKLKVGSDFAEKINSLDTRFNSSSNHINKEHLQYFSSDSKLRTRKFLNSKTYSSVLHKDIIEDFRKSEPGYGEPNSYAILTNSTDDLPKVVDNSIKRTTADVNSYLTGDEYVKNFDLDKVKQKTKRIHQRVRNTKLNQDFISYSGLDELSSSIVNETKTGGSFTLQRFLSTTLNKGVADKFLSDRQGKSILKIRNYKGQAGLPLEGAGEDEILLPNRSSFQIFDRKTRKDGIEEVYVDRLANGGRPKISGLVPGVGTGDKIPSMLSPGEVVLNQGQQNRLGRITGTSPRNLFRGIGVPFQDRSGHYAGGVDLGSSSGSVFSGGSIGKFLGIQVILDTLQALPDSLRPLSDIATATAGSFLVLDQTLKQSRGITILNAQLEEVNTRFESSGKKLQIYASKIEASDKKIAAAQKARESSKAETKKLAPELVAARQKQIKAQKEIEAINAGAVTPYGQKRNLTADEVTRVAALKKEVSSGKITEVTTRNKLSESVAATKNADAILKKEQATNKLIEERGKKQGAIHLKAAAEQAELDKKIGREQKFGKAIQVGAAVAVGAGVAIDSYGQKLLEKKKDSYAVTSGASGLLSGASSGASLGAFLGPKGAAIGAGIGAVFGGVKGFVGGKSELKAARQGSTQDFLESTLSGQEINGDALAQFNKDMKALSDSAKSSNFGAILSKTGTVIAGFGEGLLSFVPEGTFGLFGKAMNAATGALDNVVKYFGGNQLTKENTNLARKDEAFLLSQTKNIENEGDLSKFVTQNQDTFKRLAENRGSDIATQEEAMKKLVLDSLKLKKTFKSNGAIITASLDEMDQAFASIEEAFNQTQGFSSAIGAAAGAVKVTDRSSTLKNLSRVQSVDNFTNQLNVGTGFFGDYGKKVNNQARQAAGNSGKIRDLVKSFEKTDNLSGETIEKAIKENFSGLDPELYAKLQNDIIKTFGAETGTTQIDKSKIDFKNAAESAVNAVTQGIGELAAGMSKAATDAQNQLIGNLENVRNLRSQAADTSFQGFNIEQIRAETIAKNQGINAGAGLQQVERQRLGFYSNTTDPQKLLNTIETNRGKNKQIQSIFDSGHRKDAIGNKLLSPDEFKALSIEQNRLAAESENATKQLKELADVTSALSATERLLNEEEQRKGARKSIGDIEAFGTFEEKTALESNKRNLAAVASGSRSINEFSNSDARSIRDLAEQAGTSKLGSVFLGTNLGAGGNLTGQNLVNLISQQKLVQEKVSRGYSQKDAEYIAKETYGTSAEEARLQKQQGQIIDRAQGAQQGLAQNQLNIAKDQEGIAIKQYDELFKKFADNQTKAAEAQLLAANELKNVVNDMKKTVLTNGKVELAGNVKLDININGGQVLASIEPAMRTLVDRQIKAGINDFIQKKLPQLGSV